MAAPRDLLTATLRFGQTLRRAGLPRTVSELMDAVRALEVIDLMDRQEVYLALRACLVARVEEIPAFDRCFDAFWTFQAEEGQGLEGLTSPAPAPHGEEEPPLDAPAGGEQKESLALEGWEEEGADDGEPLEVPGKSEREVLMDRDFSTFPAEDLDEVARLTVLIAKRLARRVSRRRRPTRRGGVIDLRRSMRANMMKGEIIELRRRERRRRKVRLVLLCDVSGSMDLYSRFLLQFLYALQNVFGRVETFTFATRLTRVTEQLKGPSYQLALRRLTEVRDFSGGTRIGESIQEFNRSLAAARRPPHHRARPLRRMGHGRARRARRRDALPPPPRGSRDLAQPAPRQPLVRAPDAGHGGGASARRPLRRRPQPG